MRALARGSGRARPRKTKDGQEAEEEIAKPMTCSVEFISKYYMLAFWDDWERSILCESFADRC